MAYYVSVILCEYLYILVSEPNVPIVSIYFLGEMRSVGESPGATQHLEEDQQGGVVGDMEKNMGMSGPIRQMKRVFQERGSEKPCHTLLRGLVS